MFRNIVSVARATVKAIPARLGAIPARLGAIPATAMAMPAMVRAQIAQTPGAIRLIKSAVTLSTVASVVSSVDSGVRECDKYTNGQVSKEELQDNLALIFLLNSPCPFIQHFANLATQHKFLEKTDLDPASLATAVSALMPIDPVGMYGASKNLFAAAVWLIDSNKLFYEAIDKKLTGTELWNRQVSLNDKLRGAVGVG